MKNWLRAIALVEILGGAVGLIFVLWWLVTIGGGGVASLLALIVIGFYVLSIIAGVGLLQNRRFGRTVSIIVQAIQLVKIVSPALIFMFGLGLDCYVYFVGTAGFINLGFRFNLLPEGQLFFNAQGAPFGLGVSVTAAIFMGALLKTNRLGKEEEISPPPPPPSWE